MQPADDLQHFIEAQQHSFEQALDELHCGHKRSHWMWFIFPQLQGLGHSEMARRYALSGVDQAKAYLAHPLLGPRLQACSRAVLSHPQRTAKQIFGHPDDLKLHSCMTLFDLASPGTALFSQALQVFFDGQPDPATLAGLALAGRKPMP